MSVSTVVLWLAAVMRCCGPERKIVMMGTWIQEMVATLSVVSRPAATIDWTGAKAVTTAIRLLGTAVMKAVVSRLAATSASMRERSATMVTETIETLAPTSVRMPPAAMAFGDRTSI